MRKYFLSLVAMAAMIFLSGCNKNEDFYISENGDMVTFNIATPEMGTRAISDGTTVSKLYVAVYQGGVYRPALTESDGYDINNKTATVSLPLVTGVTYDIVFWAEAAGSPYTFDAENGVVNVQYSGVKANNENLDAFYANRLGYTVEGPKTETVNLTRPFAQLNVATLDYDWAANSGIEITETAIEVEGVYTSFNLLNEYGAVTGIPTTLRLSKNDIPSEDLNVNNKNYKWISMNYLLVNEKTTVRAKMTTNNENVTREWYNIPVQRNYRTNIVGNILTTTTDFNVVIDERFAGDINYTSTVTTQEDFNNALQQGGLIRLAKQGSTTKANSADYVWPKQTPEYKLNTSFEIIGIEEGIVIEMQNSGAITSNINVAFNNVTLKFNNVNYSGFIHSETETFENCTIIGQPFLYAKVSTFENCTFEQESSEWYNVWTYGSKNATFNNCTFKSAGKAVLIYRENGDEWNSTTFNNCSFKATKQVDGKAAIEIDTQLAPAEIFINKSTSEGFANGSISNNTLWNVKKDKTPSNARVYVDGKLVYGEKEVYEISNVEELKAFALEVNNGNSFKGHTIVLTQDIDLNNEEWTPIGNPTAFQGIFDGQNHTISNLLISGYNSTVGLFANTDSGEIKNLKIRNAKVSGRLNVGVVSGNPYTSKYTNIELTGHVEVKGMSYVGGIGGKNAYANWENITINVDETSFITANSTENGTAYRTYVGGVVGFNGEGGHSFTNITSNIDVKGSTCDVGGLFGIAHYGNNFVNCSSSGDVEIYAADDIDSAEEIGGIAGVWHNQNGTTVTFTNCSFTGELRTNVEGVDLTDNKITGKAYSQTGTGRLIIDGLTSQMISEGVMQIGEDKYSISSAAGLQWVANEVNIKKNNFEGKTVILANDIDLKNIDWEPIGQTGVAIFKGVFDGKNHTISNLNVNSEEEVGKHYSSGLFGWVEASKAVIKNVKVSNATIKGHHNCAAIVGYLIGTVENCHVSNSTISCTSVNDEANGDKAGSIAGILAEHNAFIKDCSAKDVKIDAGRDAGQITGCALNGWATSNITNCSATNVTVTWNNTSTGANIREELVGRK